MTLAKAIDGFLIDRELAGCTPKTLYDYRLFLSFFMSYIGDKSRGLERITIDIVNEYQIGLLRRESRNDPGRLLTRKSVQTYVRHLKVFLAYCYRKGLITEDIAGSMRLPKAEYPMIEILSDEEIDKVFSCFCGSRKVDLRNRAVIMLMVDCGLRLSEVTNMKISGVDFNRRYIYVDGKGRKGRIVPFGSRVYESLQQYHEKRYKSDIQAFFLTDDNKPITNHAISSLFYRLKRRSGIARIHPHLLRHTFATNFLLAGLGDVYELSRLLGHSEVGVTEHYLHLASYYAVLRGAGKSYLDRLYT